MPLNAPIQDWRGLRIWLVGASSGIGAALALALLRQGAKVALTARRDDLLTGLASAGAAGEALVLPADVTQPDALAKAFGAILERWGGCDVVILIAGTHTPVRSWDIDSNQARQLIDVNLTGAFNVLSVVTPQLCRQGSGGIAVVASVAGYRGLPTGLVYGATKAALINVAQTLYLDLAPRGISVWLVNPGFVKTPLTDRNEFPMPALISADEAALRIMQGMERGRFEIHFPLRFTRVMKLLRWLPDRWYFALIHRMTGL